MYIILYATMTHVFYTDGSCLGNPGKGGWAYIHILNDEIIHKDSGSQSHATNNIMELKAVLYALTYIKDNSIKHSTLYTDSNYVKLGITQWMQKWKTKNWKCAKGSSVKNLELWKALSSLIDDLRDNSISVNFQYVKAHSVNKYNNMVDEIARTYAFLA